MSRGCVTSAQPLRGHTCSVLGAVQMQQMQLVFWDLGGQSGLRSIWDKYYAESNAVLYVVDASAFTTPPDQCFAK